MHVFELLAEPVRLRIVEILATGEHTAGQLADVLSTEFGVSRAAVSRHLGILRREEFARVRIEGPVRVYRLDAQAIDRVHRAVDRLDELWNARYGWPYLADPLAAEAVPGATRIRRGRGRRGRSAQPVIVEVSEDNDLWRWIGD